MMAGVSDEAVSAAARVFYGDAYGSVGDEGNRLLHDGAREALSAALPYLAPAGDGGLREAVKQLAKEWAHMDCRVDLPENAQWGEGVAQGYSNAAAGLLRTVSAHPAAPAVPQPVDREALAKAAHTYYCVKKDAPTHPFDQEDYDKADEILDILALLNGSRDECQS